MDAFEAVSLPESSPVTGKRYFSPAEANRALPLVRRIVADVVRDYERLHGLHDRCRPPQAETNPAEAEQARQQYVSLADHLSELKDELDQIGCALKDFRLGLVDFPAWHQGREIYLCWQLGEESVEHWHETSEGFASRLPIREEVFDVPADRLA